MTAPAPQLDTASNPPRQQDEQRQIEHDRSQEVAAARQERRQQLYVVLTAAFVTCLVLGDVIGGKAIPTADVSLWGIALGGPISVGIIPFPITFLLTDIINDFYGRRAALFVTAVGAAMATLAVLLLTITTALPAHPDTYFTQSEYQKIFGGSAQLFIASLVAYAVGQVLDIHVFQAWKRLTRARHLWLRATGSTLIGQLVDTVTINVIFWRWTADKDWDWIAGKSGREYVIKLLVAVLLTPVVYLLHALVSHGLGLQPAPAEPKRPSGSA